MSLTSDSPLDLVSEGVFLLRRGLDPYDGGAFNHVRPGGVLARRERSEADNAPLPSVASHIQSPLYLLVFSTIMPIGSRLLVPLVWTAADGLSGWILADIWRTRQQRAVAKNGLGVDDRQNWESLVVFLCVANPPWYAITFAHTDLFSHPAISGTPTPYLHAWRGR